MAAFSLPAFSRLSQRINRAERELQQLCEYYGRHCNDVEAGDWGAIGAVSLGIHNVYNGMEDILFSLAKDLDGAVPTGPTMHQDVLEQMAADVQGVRSALLAEPLYEALTELKAFRHLVRHRYGFDLRSDKVIENLGRLGEAFPKFVQSVVDLEKRMLET